jgi:hypothetical protein
MTERYDVWEEFFKVINLLLFVWKEVHELEIEMMLPPYLQFSSKQNINRIQDFINLCSFICFAAKILFCK